MTDQTPVILNCSQYLSTYFDDEKLLHVNNTEELRERLTERVVYLLLHEMGKLLGILYRVDVNEKEVKKVFAQNDPKQIAPGLVDLIIKRELQKAETRVKHKPTKP
jgi:hypothetical protein